MIKAGGRVARGLLKFGLAALIGLGLATGAAAGEKIQSVTQYNYDANFRPLCTAVRMNSVIFGTPTLDSVDACVLSAQRGNGPDRITKQIYNTSGQVLQVLQGFGNNTTISIGSSNVNLTFLRAYATYTYSANGKVLDTIDARGNRTRNQYNALDMLERVYYPCDGSETYASCKRNPGDSVAGLPLYNPLTANSAVASAGRFDTGIPNDPANPGDYEAFTYDKNGNKLTWRRRDGLVISYTYDKLNRQILKDVPADPNAPAGLEAKDVATTYDLLGNITSRQFADGSSGITYTYNPLGWMVSSSDWTGNPYDANARIVTYKYNAAGARTDLGYPSLRSVAYQLDNLNRVTRATVSSQILYSLAYNDLGQRRKIQRGGALSTWDLGPNSCATSTGATCYGYDGLGRLTSMKHDFAAVTGGVADINWTFAYNPASQVTRSGATTAEFDYYQSGSLVEQPRFDGLNRDQARLYDVRGNITYDGASERSFYYDIENRLVKVDKSGAAVASLAYDPEGRLKTYKKLGTSEVTTTFVYDGVNAIAEYAKTGSTTILSETYFGPGVDEPLAGYNGANSTYKLYWANYQGSIVGVSGTGGSILTNGEFYKYSPYGEPTNYVNGSKWSGSRFLYTGQMALPEAEIYHYKARAYDPKLGRFLQTDPIGGEDDLNLYAYVGGDPTNNTDPTGTLKFKWLVETVKGWKRVATEKMAMSARKAGKNVEASGSAASRRARRVEEKVTGKDNTVRHEPHPNGDPSHKGTNQAHYQPKDRPKGDKGKGHTFFSVSPTLLAAGLSAQNFGVEPSTAALIDNTVNPAADVESGIDILKSIPDAILNVCLGCSPEQKAATVESTRRWKAGEPQEE